MGLSLVVIDMLLLIDLPGMTCSVLLLSVLIDLKKSSVSFCGYRCAALHAGSFLVYLMLDTPLLILFLAMIGYRILLFITMTLWVEILSFSLSNSFPCSLTLHLVKT